MRLARGSIPQQVLWLVKVLYLFVDYFTFRIFEPALQRLLDFFSAILKYYYYFFDTLFYSIKSVTTRTYTKSHLEKVFLICQLHPSRVQRFATLMAVKMHNTLKNQNRTVEMCRLSPRIAYRHRLLVQYHFHASLEARRSLHASLTVSSASREALYNFSFTPSSLYYNDNSKLHLQRRHLILLASHNHFQGSSVTQGKLLFTSTAPTTYINLVHLFLLLYLNINIQLPPFLPPLLLLQQHQLPSLSLSLPRLIHHSK